MFEQESVAPFINFRGGMSSIGNAPYRWQSASTYSGDEVDFIYGGEFGVYLRGGRMGIAFGVLVHTFDAVAGGKGLGASGAELFSVDLEGLGYGPSVTFDYQISTTKTYLWKILLGGGYAFNKLESTYTYTVAGQALNGGSATLTESYKSESPYVMLGISTEFHLSGTTTINVTAGYHYNTNSEWKYGQGGQNFAGSHAQGDSLRFEDSTTKSIEWSYYFVQVGFNFYVDTLR